ncbi:MAG TPA: 2Fe-2S iron-sulfur cluster-binding protein, partial [Anaerolineaceae bacterium]|nr:2Fe-2S iron-sulfur cluster-binding protein [Anaerolineaceae bacterium]
MINLTIDGKAISVTEGTTVLQAAREAGIEIPTLCDHPELTPYGGCR